MSKHQKTVKTLVKAGMKVERAVLLVTKANGLTMHQMELLHFSVKG